MTALRVSSVKAYSSDYREVCFGDTHSKVVRKTLLSYETWTIHHPYIYCGLLEDVHIFGRSFVHTRDGVFIFHCQSYQNHRGFQFAALAEHCILKREDLFQEYVDEECIFLGGGSVEIVLGKEVEGVFAKELNFGHFIFEYLNRLVIFDHYGLLDRLPVVVYDNIPEKWLDFVRLMGVKRIIRVPINGPAYRKVWVSSAPHYRDSAGGFRFWAAGVHALRSKLLKAIGSKSVAKARRVYIGRQDALWRKVTNESAVEAVLRAYDFETPLVASLSAAEQISTVADANIIVCALGAGAVMTQFAPEHCIIILLGPDNVGHGVWGGLAAAMTLRQAYERIDCQPTAKADTQRARELIDFTVDLPTLKSTVETAIKVTEQYQQRDALCL